MSAVLLIAYHYPPCAVSSGLQRTFANSIYLPKFGWQGIVLTVSPQAYARTSQQQLERLPPSVVVHRSLAVDLAGALSIRGRYFSPLAVPDRWRSWWLTAVPAALRLVRRHKISAIWSTYPIATAHTIGATVARLTGVPWIADFRDPMVETLPATGETFPREPELRRARLAIEARAVSRAARLVFCTEGARQIVHARYPQLSAARTTVIANGFDEDEFVAAEATSPKHQHATPRVLLHSGTIYPSPDRDPTALFQAIRQLAAERVIDSSGFELRLRDPSSEAHFARQARDLGISEFVSILPPLSYRDALAEMLTADGLLLLQGYNSNPAIPAKFYEYLRARRPIVALVHPEGETAAALRAAGLKDLAPLTDATAIAALLRSWLAAPRDDRTLPSREVIAAYSRERRAADLAKCLNTLREQS